MPYTEVIAIEEFEVVSEVTKQVIVPVLTEAIIEEVTTKIELNITNESAEQINTDVKDDKETEGQITLEL